MDTVVKSAARKAVIITGAGTGIGAACAREFAKNNYLVFLLGRRSEVLEKLKTQVVSSVTIPCDLTKNSEVENAVQKIISTSDIQLECLVNNAGIFKTHKVDEGGDELWLDQFNTNLFGSVRITQKLFPYFRRQKKGSIVNVSSTLGLSPTAETSAYSASKAAMISWTQSLALAGGADNIRCNCVCPGLVDTPIHGFHFLDDTAKSSALEGLNSLQPLGRIGKPEEIAKAVYFLASEASSWTTGAVLAVDGGINLQ